jgi:hypothetical protein
MNHMPQWYLDDQEHSHLFDDTQQEAQPIMKKLHTLPRNTTYKVISYFDSHEMHILVGALSNAIDDYKEKATNLRQQGDKAEATYDPNTADTPTKITHHDDGTTTHEYETTIHPNAYKSLAKTMSQRAHATQMLLERVQDFAYATTALIFEEE